MVLTNRSIRHHVPAHAPKASVEDVGGLVDEDSLVKMEDLYARERVDEHVGWDDGLGGLAVWVGVVELDVLGWG